MASYTYAAYIHFELMQNTFYAIIYVVSSMFYVHSMFIYISAHDHLYASLVMVNIACTSPENRTKYNPSLYSRIVASITYFTLVLLSSRLDGNPFLNFLFQSAIELPAYKIGQILSDNLGRRASNSLAFLTATIICIPIVLIIRNAEYESMAIALSIAIKFCVSINFFAVNLQSIEIYPTCLRQTGLAFAAIMANLFGIFGPYVVYLGTEYDVRYPFVVIGLMSALGATCASFLPETLHQSLPETIEQAQKFGKTQKFWSLPKKPRTEGVEIGQEMEEGVRLKDADDDIR